VHEPRLVREGREKADAVRYEQGLGRAPIRDLFGFIERNFDGVLVIVRPMPDGPDGGLLRADDRWLIVVNSLDQTLARQRFTAAHELGHYLFDRHADPVHLDHSLFARPDPAETRANAFAVHLILPASVIQQRKGDAAFDPNDPSELVTLAMEFGLSLQSLSWHLKNVLGLSDAERRRIAAIPTPLRLASELGLANQVREELAAKGRFVWPQRYLALASRAFARGEVDQAELSRLLEDPDLAAEIATVNASQGRLGA
jgi:Zn-dependent peptidase ImmA (M78 family)